MPLRIYLTGRMGIEHAGGLIDQDAFPGRQGLVVFSRLAVERPHALSRDELAAMLWPEKFPRAWDTALNSIMSKLRLLLGRSGLDKSDVLPTRFGCYSLNLPADAWVDFETAIDSIHKAEGLLRGGKWRESWAEAQVAYQVSRRPFLAGESGPWVEQQRERLQVIFARACECLAESYIRNDEPALAVDVAEQVVAIQPFRETGYQLLMRAHAAAGNRAEALRVFERCRSRISEELGVAPSTDTHEVYLKILHAR